MLLASHVVGEPCCWRAMLLASHVVIAVLEEDVAQKYVFYRLMALCVECMTLALVPNPELYWSFTQFSIDDDVLTSLIQVYG